jgi:hypothetical protein
MMAPGARADAAEKFLLCRKCGFRKFWHALPPPAILLARSSTRQREFAMRLSLGAP